MSLRKHGLARCLWLVGVLQTVACSEAALGSPSDEMGEASGQGLTLAKKRAVEALRKDAYANVADVTQVGKSSLRVGFVDGNGALTATALENLLTVKDDAGQVVLALALDRDGTANLTWDGRMLVLPHDHTTWGEAFVLKFGNRDLDRFSHAAASIAELTKVTHLTGIDPELATSPTIVLVSSGAVGAVSTAALLARGVGSEVQGDPRSLALNWIE